MRCSLQQHHEEALPPATPRRPVLNPGPGDVRAGFTASQETPAGLAQALPSPGAAAQRHEGPGVLSGTVRRFHLSIPSHRLPAGLQEAGPVPSWEGRPQVRLQGDSGPGPRRQGSPLAAHHAFQHRLLGASS